LVKVGCTFEDFDFKEIVFLGASKFNSKRRLILVLVEGKNPILLTPNIFRRMLRFPTLNKFLQLSEDDSFLDSQGDGANLLKDFLALSTTMPANTTQVDINLLS
jgi:hypothetical protein